MKYLVFENKNRVIDSIILKVDNSVTGIVPNDENCIDGYVVMEQGWGNFTIHKSGGYIFNNLRDIKNWLKCKRDFTFQDSTIRNDEVERKNITHMIYRDMNKFVINFHHKNYGAYNLDLYCYKGIEEDGVDRENCYQEYKYFISNK